MQNPIPRFNKSSIIIYHLKALDFLLLLHYIQISTYMMPNLFHLDFQLLLHDFHYTLINILLAPHFQNSLHYQFTCCLFLR